MSEVQIFILILVVHFLADFGLQTHDQATLKSSSHKFLFYHVAVYTAVWSMVFFFLPINKELNAVHLWLVMVFYIFTTHYITDYFTSRIGKTFWNEKDFHNGFVVYGFDQILHYLSLIYLLLGTNFLKI